MSTSQNRIGMPKCVFRHTEVDSQPNKKPKKSGGTGSVALLKNSMQLGWAAEIKVDFVEKHKVLGTEAQRALFQRHLTRRENTGKKGSIAGCYSAF